MCDKLKGWYFQSNQIEQKFVRTLTAIAESINDLLYKISLAFQKCFQTSTLLRHSESTFVNCNGSNPLWSGNKLRFFSRRDCPKITPSQNFCDMKNGILHGKHELYSNFLVAFTFYSHSDWVLFHIFENLWFGI